MHRLRLPAPLRGVRARYVDWTSGLDGFCAVTFDATPRSDARVELTLTATDAVASRWFDAVAEGFRAALRSAPTRQLELMAGVDLALTGVDEHPTASRRVAAVRCGVELRRQLARACERTPRHTVLAAIARARTARRWRTAGWFDDPPTAALLRRWLDALDEGERRAPLEGDAGRVLDDRLSERGIDPAPLRDDAAHLLAALDATDDPDPWRAWFERCEDGDRLEPVELALLARDWPGDGDAIPGPALDAEDRRLIEEALAPGL